MLLKNSSKKLKKKHSISLYAMVGIKKIINKIRFLKSDFNHKRTFLTCIFHTLGKKPLIDEWHTPAKAVFSFYDKSLQP